MRAKPLQNQRETAFQQDVDQTSTLNEIKEFLTKQIDISQFSKIKSFSIPINPSLKQLLIILQTRLLQVRRNTKGLQNIQIPIYIGKLLKQLLKAFIKTTKKKKLKSFYKFIEKKLGISDRVYRSYQSFHKFYEEYTRFQQVPLLYSKWRSMNSLIIDWFESDDCLILPSSNPHSRSYWVEEDDEEEVQILQVRSTINTDRLETLFSNLKIDNNIPGSRRDSGIAIPDISTSLI
jgi:hypothetical protein